MAFNVRFIGVPAPILREIISLEPGWRILGERMLERARATCPVGDETAVDPKAGGGYSGPHLKETLEVRFITGEDPRILIGTSKKGDVLNYVTQGHGDITPQRANVLRFVAKGGTVVFTKHVGPVDPNPFLMNAIKSVAQETSIAGVA